jgi:prepilin-type processing-associated H-X9-DG protein
MELRARIRPQARRAAVTAVLGALLVPVATGTATADAAKRKKVRYPVVTAVSPMNVAVGETLTIAGRNFRRGRNKNTVVFKRDGARAVFVKAKMGTAKKLQLEVPDKLAEFFAQQAGEPAPTRFRLRILAERFSKSFTSDSRSPMVHPAGAPAGTPAGKPAVAPKDGDCDADGLLNGVDTDDDNDLLDDETEKSLGLDPCKPDSDEDGVADRYEFDCDRDGTLNRDETDADDDLLPDDLETPGSLGTDPCNADTDGDGAQDGYEVQSAGDLNDDEYQTPNSHLPYPGKRPYPNALFADGHVDYDGDTLTLLEEYKLWVYTYSVTKTDPRSLASLSYSDGEQYSKFRRIASGPDAGRREPTVSRVNYDKQVSFLDWANDTDNDTDNDPDYDYRNPKLQIWDPYNPDDPDDPVPYPWWDHANGRLTYGLLDMNRDNAEAEVAPRDRANGIWYDVTEKWYFDHDDDGFLSDDERDEDADGLTNYDETHGRMTAAYWKGCYKNELPYHIEYASPSHVDDDSDGDGIRDGADDQDHDDIPNVMELSRIAASGIDDRNLRQDCVPRKTPPLPPELHHEDSFGRVNPFNPCLPEVRSRTCPTAVNAATGAPFDGSPDWYSLN